MCEVLSAANYLLIKPLLDLICLFSAYELHGKSEEEVCSCCPISGKKYLTTAFTARGRFEIVSIFRR